VLGASGFPHFARGAAGLTSENNGPDHVSNTFRVPLVLVASPLYLKQHYVSHVAYTTANTNGQTYFYEVTAVNPAGESTQSNEASATPS
jgi:hypothetical protein